MFQWYLAPILLMDVPILAEGYMPAITLRKGKTSYTVANPIFLSKQFVEEIEDEEGTIIETKRE